VTDSLPLDTRTRLLEHARETLRATAAGRAPEEAPRGGVLDELAAVFVTLHRGGELRGCLGQTIPRSPLGAAVREMTVDAATQDPRFPPVTPEEVPEIHIEISRLSTPVPATAEEVVVGRHGVVIRAGARVGLLLPQVATEFGCDALQFLELACRKAGLPTSAWQDEGVSISVFEAEVFGE
jgi:AmmeMemoRadiSam system protein A